MKKIFLVILSLLIMIPAYAGVKSFMEKCLNSWVSYSLNDVIRFWGYPTEEKEIAGKHLFIWHDSKTVYIPQTSTTYGNVRATANSYGNSTYTNGTYNSTTTTYGGQNITYYCNRILEVNSDNIIIDWQWEGNSCPGTYCGGKKWVNPANDPWQKEKTQKREQKQKMKQMSNEERKIMKKYYKIQNKHKL